MLNKIKSLLFRLNIKGYGLHNPGRAFSGNVTAVKSSLGFWYVGNIFDNSDISYGILRNGVVEEHETNLVINILDRIYKKKSELTFFDIGANTGYYGILSGHRFRGLNSRVFSFEPIKEFADCLSESIAINSLNETISCLNIGVSDFDGEAEINMSGSGTSLHDDFNGGQVLNKRAVSLRKLDSLYKEAAIERPDFIKIDVEGHEFNVLQGGEELIKSSRPVIFLEIIKKYKARNYVNKNYENTIEKLKVLGYRIFVLDDDKLHELSDNNERDGVYMYLCLLPEEHGYLIDGLGVL